MARKFHIIVKGLENGHTKLRTDIEKEQLDQLYKPKRRGLPEPLILPPESNRKFSFIFKRNYPATELFTNTSETALINLNTQLKGLRDIFTRLTLEGLSKETPDRMTTLTLPDSTRTE